MSTIRARGLALVAAAALAACASPPPRYYSLADADAPPAAGSGGGAAGFIELAPIAMPERFARPQMVVRRKDADAGPEVDILEEHRWSSSFENELRDALGSGVAQRLGAVDATKGGRLRGRPVTRIAVQLRQFDAVEGRRVDAGFSWSLRLAEDSPAVACQLFVSVPVEGGGMDALARGARRATAQLADAIARSVNATQAHAANACPP